VDVTEALRVGDRNLGDYVRLLAEVANGQWEEADGLVLFAGAHAYPGTHTNGIVRLDADLPAEAALARADAFFRARKRSYTVWIRDAADADLEAAVQARGFELRPPEDGMGFVLHDRPFDLAEHPVAPDAELRTFADEDVRVDYVRIVGQSFGVEGVPVETLARLFFDPASLADPRVSGYVAYVDGTAVSGCQVFVSSGFAGLYSGVTLPAARGRGLARAVLARCVNDGLAAGPRYTGGQSSEMGNPVWVKMGFVTAARYRRYIGRPPR
jgi:hypothetical protein